MDSLTSEMDLTGVDLSQLMPNPANCFMSYLDHLILTKDKIIELINGFAQYKNLSTHEKNEVLTKLYQFEGFSTYNMLRWAYTQVQKDEKDINNFKFFKNCLHVCCQEDNIDIVDDDIDMILYMINQPNIQCNDDLSLFVSKLISKISPDIMLIKYSKILEDYEKKSMPIPNAKILYIIASKMNDLDFNNQTLAKLFTGLYQNGSYYSEHENTLIKALPNIMFDQLWDKMLSQETHLRGSMWNSVFRIFDNKTLYNHFKSILDACPIYYGSKTYQTLDLRWIKDRIGSEEYSSAIIEQIILLKKYLSELSKMFDMPDQIPSKDIKQFSNAFEKLQFLHEQL